MAHSGNGDGWDVTIPATSSEYVTDGALELRDLRLGVEIRGNKEHAEITTSSAGFEHLEGSARITVKNAAPSYQVVGAVDKDGAAANVSLADTAPHRALARGRMWADSTNGYTLEVYDDDTPGWHSVNYVMPVEAASTAISVFAINITGTAATKGVDIDNQSTNVGSAGMEVTNTSVGSGISVANSGAGEGVYVANSSTGNGVDITNSSTGDGILIANTSTGNGINITQSNTDGVGLNCVVTAVSAGTIPRGLSISISAEAIGRGIEINNAGTSTSACGILLTNSDAGRGIIVANTGASSTGIYATSSGSSTGKSIYAHVYSGSQNTQGDAVYAHVVGDDPSHTASGSPFVGVCGEKTTGPVMKLQHDSNRAHIRFLGNPTVASPVDGDFWLDSTGVGGELKVRINGATYTLDKTAV